MPTITLLEAETIIEGAKAKIQELGVKMSVSVTDSRGDLIAMIRTDGASWRTPFISRGKAVASACFGEPPHALVASLEAVVVADPIVPELVAVVQATPECEARPPDACLDHARQPTLGDRGHVGPVARATDDDFLHVVVGALVNAKREIGVYQPT